MYKIIKKRIIYVFYNINYYLFNENIVNQKNNFVIALYKNVHIFNQII